MDDINIENEICFTECVTYNEYNMHENNHNNTCNNQYNYNIIICSHVYLE